MRKYYAFLYSGGKSCTTQALNGRYYVSGELHIFKSVSGRQRWLNGEYFGDGQHSGLREAISRQQAIKNVGREFFKYETSEFERQVNETNQTKQGYE